MGTILIISIIYAMSKSLQRSEVHKLMVAPLTKLIKTPTLAYWVIGLLMMVISWFFWPSPAVALMGAVLLPVAVNVGLPAMGVAVAMNLFGHGIALSGDFIIQGAPKLTADAAGIPVSEVVSASVPLVIVMGVVTTISAFWFLKRDMKKGIKSSSFDLGGEDKSGDNISEREFDQTLDNQLSDKAKKFMAIMIPSLFFLDVIVMVLANLQGGDATALIGGTAIFLLIVNSMLTHKNNGLEKVTEYIITGLKFGFRVFGPVIPIAAFFINSVLASLITA
jgi:hypothetical protein